MDVISFDSLRNQGNLVLKNDGIIVKAKKSWIIAGEDRLAYTTIIELVECCREYHWQKDINSVIQGESLDSICRKISCDFMKPILSETEVFIKYNVIDVGKKSYSLKLSIFDKFGDHLYADITLISVFYDAISNKSLIPPERVLNKLKSIMRG